MYGTIARMRVKPGKEAELAKIGRESAQGIPGLVFEHIFKMDADPNEYMLVVAFTDKASYRANAESPGKTSATNSMSRSSTASRSGTTARSSIPTPADRRWTARRTGEGRRPSPVLPSDG